MKERADAPTEISQTDLDRSNPNVPGDTDIDSFATRQETLDALNVDESTPDETEEADEEEE